VKIQINWIQLGYAAGLAAFFTGTLDPLEGSVIIAAGSLLMALCTHLSHHKLRKGYLAAAILIAAGVMALFYFSSLGGFGGSQGLSWWLACFVLPYPLGWLMTLLMLILPWVKKKMQAFS
jgi:hypothetical protein